MGSKTIEELAARGTPVGSDVMVVSVGGVAKQTTVTDILNVDHPDPQLASLTVTGAGSFGGSITSNGEFNTTTSYSFKISNTEIMGITSAGNVGIGTSSPSAKLEVNNGADGIPFRVFGASSSTYGGIGITTDTVIFDASNTGSTSTEMVFRTSASGVETERMRITSSGVLDLATGTSGGILTDAQSLPTSNPGAGLLWNNSGVVNVGT